MNKKLMSKKRLVSILNEYPPSAEPAEMPKKQYSEPKAKKVFDRAELEAALADLLYNAGGRAPGYRRQLNQILDRYL